MLSKQEISCALDCFDNNVIVHKIFFTNGNTVVVKIKETENKIVIIPSIVKSCDIKCPFCKCTGDVNLKSSFSDIFERMEIALKYINYNFFIDYSKFVLSICFAGSGDFFRHIDNSGFCSNDLQKMTLRLSSDFLGLRRVTITTIVPYDWNVMFINKHISRWLQSIRSRLVISTTLITCNNYKSSFISSAGDSYEILKMFRNFRFHELLFQHVCFEQSVTDNSLSKLINLCKECGNPEIRLLQHNGSKSINLDNTMNKLKNNGIKCHILNHTGSEIYAACGQ